MLFFKHCCQVRHATHLVAQSALQISAVPSIPHCLTNRHSDWKAGIIWINNHSSESEWLAELCVLIRMAELPRSWEV